MSTKQRGSLYGPDDALFLATNGGQRGSSAFRLLMALQERHRPCVETFPLNTRRLSSSEIVPGWRRHRYRRAISVLERLRYLRKVEAARNTCRGRQHALYKLDAPRLWRAAHESLN